MAKKNDYILIDELGDAFRHAGQNPADDVIKDMVEKVRALKKPGETNVDLAGQLSDRRQRKQIAGRFIG